MQLWGEAAERQRRIFRSPLKIKLPSATRPRKGGPVRLLYTLTLASGLKKYTVFSLHRTENCGVFCVFHTFLSHRVKNVLRLAQKTMFCNRQIGVFWPSYGVIINYYFNVCWRGGEINVWKKQENPQFSVRKKKSTRKPCTFLNRTLRLGYIQSTYSPQLNAPVTLPERPLFFITPRCPLGGLSRLKKRKVPKTRKKAVNNCECRTDGIFCVWHSLWFLLIIRDKKCAEVSLLFAEFLFLRN
jgi:hypothetical protein